MRVFTLRWLVTGAISVFTLASIGCAASTGFEMLMPSGSAGPGRWRADPGGVLGGVPAVPAGPEQTIATTMGGVLAVLAPALGPITGGLVTENLSWHWLFLINVIPGILTAVLAMVCLPRERPQFRCWPQLDWVSLGLIAVALAALEIGLKEAPGQGLAFANRRPAVSRLCRWHGAGGHGGRRRSSISACSRTAILAFGCAISFILGMGLYGSVYLLPLFLAFVQPSGADRHWPDLAGDGQRPTHRGTDLGLSRHAVQPPSCSAPWALRCFAIGLGMSGFETRGVRL